MKKTGFKNISRADFRFLSQHDGRLVAINERMLKFDNAQNRVFFSNIFKSKSLELIPIDNAKKIVF